MKIKNALRGLAFNLVNIWDPGIYKDTNEIKVIKKLRKDIAIFKPDKSSGVVLLNKNDYTAFARNLFKDNRKFKTLESDPTITQTKTLQSYLNTLHKRNEL